MSLAAVVVDAQRFALNGKAFSYRFHADEASGDLISDHFGGPVTELFAGPAGSIGGGWSSCEHLRREFPDLGRGDFRSPAVRITQAEGHTVSAFKYVAHEVSRGKPRLPVVQMYDSVSALQVDLRYSVFAKHDALARSATVTNKSDKPVVVEKLASFSTDLPYDDYDMLQLRGEWVRECTRTRRKVDYGTQG